MKLFQQAMAKTADGQLKISQLAAFVAVAERGSFSAAALELGLAQSTVSHAIATLEEDLGVVLLLRGRSGAVLTPIGSQIFQQAAGILQQLGELKQTANRAKELQTGRVRVAAVRTVATHILPDAIAQFRRSHPGLTVEIAEYDRYAGVEQALQHGQADLGFTILPAPPEFQAWELFREEFVALLPPGEVLAKDALSDRPDNSQEEPPLTWTQLVSYARVVNERSTHHNQLVEDHLARFGYHLPADYKVREDSTLMSMVKEGLGAAVLARLEAEPIPPGVKVKSLPEPLERVVGVVTLESAVLPRAVFVFLDVLLALPL